MPPLANTRNCRKTPPAQEQLQWIFVEQYFGEEKQWNIVLLPDPRAQPTLGMTSAHQQGPATTKSFTIVKAC